MKKILIMLSMFILIPSISIAEEETKLQQYIEHIKISIKKFRLNVSEDEILNNACHLLIMDYKINRLAIDHFDNIQKKVFDRKELKKCYNLISVYDLQKFE